jgi:serine protease Do
LVRLAWVALIALLVPPPASAADALISCAADIGDVVAPLLAATVSISTVRVSQGQLGPHPDLATGSGFIIGPDGLIVTNNHVTNGATEISVTLHDNVVLPATIVGEDELTDLTVLRVHPETKLPTVAWGDSDKLRIGQPVIAIGNPYAVGMSVSGGVISALGRDIKEGPYDDYIQTDATINRGNSGGPLFNLQGKVVGVNAVVFTTSRTGGSVGIGFAIPSNVARFVVSQLVQRGYVRRGWVGLKIQAMTPAMADSLGLPRVGGAIVVAPTPGGPAAHAGLESGDAVLDFGNQPVEDFRDLSRAVAMADIGAAVPMTVWRNGARYGITVTVGERPGELPRLESPPETLQRPISRGLGLALSPISAAVRAQYHLTTGQEGMLVTRVVAGSAAASQGLRAGDVILRVQDHPAASDDLLDQEVARQQKRHRSHLLLLITGQDGTRWVALPLG